MLSLSHFPIILVLICLSICVQKVLVSPLDCPQGFIPRNPSPAAQFSSLERNELKISTFNAYWLFNETRSVSYWPWRTQDALDEHHSNVMQVFSTLNSDIINLVEVSEDCDFLHRLVEGSSLNDTTNVYVVRGTDTSTKQNVALLTPHPTTLSRSEMRWGYPLPQSKCGYCKCSPDAPLSTTGVSKHYFATFNFKYNLHDDDHWFPLVVVGVHFKAIPTDPPSCAQREAQATIIVENVRLIINQIKDEHPDKTPSVVILGDMNDWDDQIVDKGQNRPTSKALRILRDGLNLTNVVHTLTEPYSHWWDSNDNLRIDVGELSLLDHILVSSHMSDAIKDVKIHSSDLYPNGSLTVSDHWPVSVTFDVERLSELLFNLNPTTDKVYRCDQDTSLSPSVCSSNGKCVLDGVCECSRGFMGDSCQEMSCNGLASTDKKVCGGRGDCIGPDTCNCTDPLYTGQFCHEKNYFECFGVPEFAPKEVVCSGHGQCIGENQCSCDAGYTRAKCEEPICYELAQSHSQVCSGHGQCVQPQICHCASGWAGEQCEIAIRDSSKDPQTDDTPSSDLYTRATVLTAVAVAVLSTSLLCGACCGGVVLVKAMVGKGGKPLHRTLADEEFEMKSDEESALSSVDESETI